MKFTEFLSSYKELLEASPLEELGPDSKYLFLSDLHLGDGGRADDLRHNRGILQAALVDYYLERGYTLILGGDIEDLSKFKLKQIQSAWYPLYAIFDEFQSRGSLRKLVGNHDISLLGREDCRYALLHGLRLSWKGRTILAFHGHQASRVFVRYQYVSDFIVRYLAKPFNVKNTSVSGDSRRRFKTERRIYRASLRLGIVALSGHSHRPLFESTSKHEDLRFRIEALLRDFAEGEDARRDRIAQMIRLYRAEFERLERRARRSGFSKSLYDERDFIVPCLFNSGCATGKSGVTAIEIEGGTIRLAHWTERGRAREYLEREAVEKAAIAGGDFIRYILRSESLDRVFARIDLLGKAD